MSKEMKVTFLLLILFSSTLMASEDYNIEESFKNPVDIPASISSQLNKVMNKDITYCRDDKHKDKDMFEAQTVSLSKSTKVYLVKPAQMCLCGAYYCPMWMFHVGGKAANLIWSTDGTSGIEILNTKSTGYRQIKEYGGTAGHGYKSIWSWDGNSYREVYRQDYMMNGDKGCADVETFRLKDGKLASVSKECLKDIP